MIQVGGLLHGARLPAHLRHATMFPALDHTSAGTTLLFGSITDSDLDSLLAAADLLEAVRS